MKLPYPTWKWVPSGITIGPGMFKTDNAEFDNTTQVVIHKIASDGSDNLGELSTLPVGTRLHFGNWETGARFGGQINVSTPDTDTLTIEFGPTFPVEEQNWYGDFTIRPNGYVPPPPE